MQRPVSMQSLARRIRRLCVYSLAGVVVGTLGGGLFGFLCSLFHAAIHSRLDRVLPGTGSFALAGAVACLLAAVVCQSTMGGEETAVEPLRKEKKKCKTLRLSRAAAGVYPSREPVPADNLCGTGMLQTPAI